MDFTSMYLETMLCWNFTPTQVVHTPDTCYRSLLFVSTVVVRLSDPDIRLWSHFVPKHCARILGTNVSTPFFQVHWPHPGTRSQSCTLVRTWLTHIFSLAAFLPVYRETQQTPTHTTWVQCLNSTASPTNVQAPVSRHRVWIRQQCRYELNTSTNLQFSIHFYFQNPHFSWFRAVD